MTDIKDKDYIKKESLIEPHHMARRMAWELFAATGQIGYYNLFKALDEERE